MDNNGFGLQKFSQSIQKGLDFLYSSQLSYGEFRTYVSTNNDLKAKGIYISSVYTTTFVLYSISFIEGGIVDDINLKALKFLEAEMEHPTMWRFFTANRDLKYVKGRFFVKYTKYGIVPDLDDTACVSYCLKRNNIAFDSNLELFLRNRNSDGMFYTWLLDVPKRKEYGPETFYLAPPKNDICLGVNANILYYLGENEYTSKAIDSINDVISRGLELENSVYFNDKIVIYYLISRAYFNGVSSLEKSKEVIVNKILEMQKEDGSFGSVISTAFAACVLLNFNYFDDCITRAIAYILNSQFEDGHWEKEGFFLGPSLIQKVQGYYGSEELSTAICLEALARYQMTI